MYSTVNKEQYSKGEVNSVSLAKVRRTSTATTPDGITWYYEQEGTGPHIILIPDGVGDCHLYDKPTSLLAEQGFTVTTFDMPGLSRSSAAPPEAYQNVTAEKLATQIAGLLDTIGITDKATFFGCSSGGSAVLALAAYHSDRVRNVLPHEVPTFIMDGLKRFMAMHDDESISRGLAEQMPRFLVGDDEAWAGLGEDCHKRLWRNFPRWLRGYGPLPRKWEDEELTRRPVDWSVGSKTPMGLFFDNVVTATKVGIEVTVLPGMHYPYVTHPAAFSEFVAKTTRKYLSV